jgi:hypothetical protein
MLVDIIEDSANFFQSLRPWTLVLSFFSLTVLWRAFVAARQYASRPVCLYTLAVYTTRYTDFLSPV